MSVTVIVTTANEASAMVGWGWRFACARNLNITVIIPLRGSEPTLTEIELDGEPSEEHNAIIRAAHAAIACLPCSSMVETEVAQTETAEAAQALVGASPQVKLLVSRSMEPYEAILRVITSTGSKLLLLSKWERLKGHEAEFSLLNKLFRQAPCDTLLIRLGHVDPIAGKRILVPAAGGPHAICALGWGADLAMESNGVLTPLYVECDLGPLAADVGTKHLREILAQARVRLTSWVELKVVVSGDVREAIAATAAEGNHDLMMVGASDRGTVHRMLYGTIPEKLLAEPDGIAVAAMRQARPLVTRLREAAEAWLDLRVPQLDREARIELFDRLQTGARWNFDFLVLMALATSIAALGLIQNSTAVVIGAMLVAPLMMPLIAAGLALVQGNEVLMRTSIRSIFYGFFLALMIGVVCGFLSPNRALTSELAARGAPTLLDMGVALLSGIAAAYALSRANLSAALPGVAIAAALVPPLATVGISLSLGEFTNATGSAMLFATNAVLIILGASATFWASGIRNFSASPRMWMKRVFLGLLLGAALLSIPLTSVLWKRIVDNREPMVVPSKLLDEAAA
ncbi:MAG: DUF389 domain-containing protein, partial [Myxococcota bacterium]